MKISAVADLSTLPWSCEMKVCPKVQTWFWWMQVPGVGFMDAESEEPLSEWGDNGVAGLFVLCCLAGTL